MADSRHFIRDVIDDGTGITTLRGNNVYNIEDSATRGAEILADLATRK